VETGHACTRETLAKSTRAVIWTARGRMWEFVTCFIRGTQALLACGATCISLNLEKGVRAAVEHVGAAVRVPEAVRDADVGDVVEVLPVHGHKHGGQEQRKHGEENEERDTVTGNPVESLVEDHGARRVATEVGGFEEVCERREKGTATGMRLDLVAEVSVELHVGVEVGLLALAAEPRFLRAALVLEIQSFGEDLQARDKEADTRERDRAGGYKRTRPVHDVSVVPAPAG